MLKRIALRFTILCCAFLVSSALVAAPRSQAADGRSARAIAPESKSAVSSLSLQRLLSERFRFSVDIFVSLRSHEQPNQSQPGGIGTLTIVDVPDPIVMATNPTAGSGDEPDAAEKRRQEQQDAVNESSQPAVEFN